MAFRIVSVSIFRNSFSGMEYIIPEANRSYMTSSILYAHHKHIFRHNINKNLEIISNDVLKVEKRAAGQLPIVNLEKNRPLVILLAWMLAQKKHMSKYEDLYLGKGFDILKISISVKQLLWPVTGSQVVAGQAVDFLDQNRCFTPLLVHGFSVGGYLWGELLVKMNEDLDKYKNIVDRIKGQIWDSTPDICDFSKGFPHAVFPSNALLRKAVERAIDYHLRTSHEAATQHYVRSSQMFHTTFVRAPALVFIAKNDPIASLDSTSKAKETWESMGMKTFMKCWDKSKHVSHFHLHRKEYLETLDSFLAILDELNEVQEPRRHMEKKQAKMA